MSRKVCLFPIGLLFILSLGEAYAVPLDREIHRPNVDLKDFQDLAVFEDASDRNYYYVAPNVGGLVRNNGMPALSYAEALRNNQKFGILNAVFQFNGDAERLDALKNAIRAQNPAAKFGPLPMAQTSPQLAVAGTGGEACYEAEDFVTGEKVKQCISLTHKVQIAEKGPTLGEQLATSVVLSPAGVDIFPKLLAGGSGVMVNLEYVYRAALPAYKAKITADYRKLYESYAVYAGYHDGVCTDIAISDFFEKTVACSASTGKDSNGNPCSIKITYTDSQGIEQNNMFDIMPSETDDAATKEWYRQHSERVKVLWTSIDGLRKDFEKKFLEPVNGKRAEVDKTPTLGFAFRADRSRTEEMGTYEFERDSLGSIGSKRSVIPAYTTCIKVDGQSGAVENSLIGQCAAYYGGQATAASLVPVVEQFNSPSNQFGGANVGPVDWE